MTKYLLEADEDRWLAFKLAATLRGQRIKDAIIDAIDLYIQAHAEEDEAFNVEIVKTEAQRNLRAVLDENEIVTILQRLIERKKKRKGYDPHAVNLRNMLFDKLKKGVVITDKIAQELKAYASQCEDDLPPEIVKAIKNIAEAKPPS